MHRFAGTILLCGALAWTVGCAPENAKAPPTLKVSGTVKLDGKPMEGGEVRFTVAGQGPKSLPIKDGAFSGEVFQGKNEISVVWDKEGGPNPTDPTTKMMVNSVDPKFQGPTSPLSADITGPKDDFKFEVTSKK